MVVKKKLKRVDTNLEAIEALLEGKQCAIIEEVADNGYNVYSKADDASDYVQIFDAESATDVALVDGHPDFLKICKHFKWEKDPVTEKAFSRTPSPLGVEEVSLYGLVASYFYNIPYSKTVYL